MPDPRWASVYGSSEVHPEDHPFCPGGRTLSVEVVRGLQRYRDIFIFSRLDDNPAAFRCAADKIVHELDGVFRLEMS